MDQVNLLKVLADLGAKNVRPYPHTGHVQISCLLAPWTHKKNLSGEPSEDRHPSCSVSFKHEVSLAHCFSGGCEFGGTLLQYATLYNQYCAGKYGEVVDTIRYLERGDPSVKIDVIIQKYERKFARSPEIEEMMEVWDDKELSVFKRVLKKSFLTSRGISVEVAKNYEILWEERSQRVVVPVRRWDGKLVGCVGRCWCKECQSGKTHEGRYLNSINFNKDEFLYNEYLLDKTKPVFVVEGIFDCLKMVSLGFTNSVAIMGSSLSEYQASKLKVIGQPINLMFDGDPAGRKCTMRAIQSLLEKVVSLYECRVPDGKDPGDMTADEIKNSVSTAKRVISFPS